MQTNSRTAILTTLLYSDIFSYPLTKEELWQYLSTDRPISRIVFEKALLSLGSLISEEKGYYFLAGRSGVVAKRELYFRESRRKLQYAGRFIPLLSILPTVLFIGVSGSVAMYNSKKTDDIDLFIITRKKSIWLTRLLVVFLLSFTGKRRGRTDTFTADRFCANMLIDERSLRLPARRRSLYTAHEVMRMVPLFDRAGTYKKFIDANTWVKEYLPNAQSREIRRNPPAGGQNYLPALLHKALQAGGESIFLISALEPFAKWIQLWYMKRHRTTEEVTDTLLAFHPLDYQPKVLTVLRQRLTQYHIV